MAEAYELIKVPGAPSPGSFLAPTGGTAPESDLPPGFSATPPAAPPPIAAEAPQAEGAIPAGFSEQPPAPPPSLPKREIPTTEAGARGVIDALTFGTAPALAGLAEASGIPSTAKEPNEVDINPIRPLVGAYKLIDDWIAGHRDPSVTDAYERGRKAFLNDQDLSNEQHPYAFLAGQMAGSLAVPLGAGGAAAGVAGRMGRSALAGSITNAAYDAGDATSRGKSGTEIAKAAGKGAATGAAFGGAAAGVVETTAKTAGKVASIWRGQRNVDKEAGSRVISGLTKDAEQRERLGLGPPATPEEIAAKRRAGTPAYIVDTGGENTRALMRSAANTSPDARFIAKEATDARFWDQSKRLSDRIRGMIGGGNAGDILEQLELAGRKAKRPAYAKAYRAGSGGVWSPELERLTTSEAIPVAMQSAVSRGRNRAVAEGFGGFNPRVTFENGIMKFNKDAKGVMSYPDIQYWDYVQRELRDMAQAAKNSGRLEEAGALKELHKALNNELDRLVPDFAKARATAHAFFKAENALEAGENFVKLDINMAQAAKMIAKMGTAERELFRRGFASELADQIAKISDNRNVLDSIFLNNGPAKQKIMLAMGAADARELEALMRVERLVDRARKALGNSTTRQQFAEAGLAGAGAVGAFEGLKEADFNPAHIVGAALLAGAVRHGAHKIDEKVAARVGEMLFSQDPSILAKGYKIVTRDPKIFEALRWATASEARLAAHKVGPENTAAAALTGLHNMTEAGRNITHHHEDHSSQQQPAPQQ